MTQEPYTGKEIPPTVYLQNGWKQGKKKPKLSQVELAFLCFSLSFLASQPVSKFKENVPCGGFK